MRFTNRHLSQGGEGRSAFMSLVTRHLSLLPPSAILRVMYRLTALSAIALAAALLCGCDQKPSGADVKPSAPPQSSPSNSATAVTTVTKPAATSKADLITRIASVNVTSGPVAAERAGEWKQAVAQLAGQGAAALPAISEFLAKNVDVNFQVHGNDAVLGAPTLRVALLQVVEKIGGGNAVALAAQLLQATADPVELAVLTRYLERAEPGKHRATAVSAARDTLALAVTPDWDGRDVGPLFEILKKFGDAEAAGELEKYGNTWFDYTPITLAGMPGDAGVPSLIRLVKNADGRLTLGRDVYQRVLAQAAVSNTNAAAALVEEVGKIDVGAWPAVGATLAGNQLHLGKPLLDEASPLVARPDTRKYHVAVGNQDFCETTPPEKMDADDVGRRIRLIDQLLEATTNPAAIDALEHARVALAARVTEAK